MFVKHIKKLKAAEHTIALSLGWIANWAALFLSYRLNPAFKWPESGMPTLDLNNPESIYATGGFPLRAYDYPFPPLGPGPEQSEWPFVLNVIFWILIAYIVVYCLRGKFPKYFENIVGGAAVITTLIGLGYLLIRFD